MAARRTCLKNLSKLLTLPGNGVHTVNTAKERKEHLLQSYYRTTSLEKARPKWEASLNKIDTNQPLLLGIPSDAGGGIQRGANWGPLAVRQEILKVKDQFTDIGDVRVIPHLLHDKYLNHETIKLCQKALYGKVNNLPVSPLSITEEALKEIYQKYPSARVLGIGGDHSISFPLVKTWLKSRKHRKKAAIIHFDAHTDLLDKRLGIDLCFGTWTYQILEYLSSRDHIIQLGIRSSARTKQYWKKELGVTQFWANEIRTNGIDKIYKKVSSQLKRLGAEEIYISFDIDALDIKFAGATGTPEKDGLYPTDCAALINLLARDFKITGADLMEVAPFVAPEGVSKTDQQNSITVAGDLARLLLRSMSQ
jgi:agmatinase